MNDQKQQNNQDALDIEVEKEEELKMRLDSNKVPNPKPPYERDQTSASGHMPSPEVDDNALDMAKKVGLYTEAKGNEPKELNIAKEIKDNELERKKQ